MIKKAFQRPASGNPTIGMVFGRQGGLRMLSIELGWNQGGGFGVALCSRKKDFIASALGGCKAFADAVEAFFATTGQCR